MNREIERTRIGWRLADRRPLLVEEPTAIAKGEHDPTGEYPTVRDLCDDYLQHVASGECEWNDSENRPGITELVNHYCSCRQEPVDNAQLYAAALLGRLERGG